MYVQWKFYSNIVVSRPKEFILGSKNISIFIYYCTKDLIPNDASSTNSTPPSLTDFLCTLLSYILHILSSTYAQ